MPQSCCNAAPAVPKSSVVLSACPAQSYCNAATAVPQSRGRQNSINRLPLLNRAHRCPLATTTQTKIDYFRAEYPVFHETYRKHSFKCDGVFCTCYALNGTTILYIGILLVQESISRIHEPKQTRYTLIYLVLLSMSRNKRAIHTFYKYQYAETSALHMNVPRSIIQFKSPTQPLF